MVIILKKSVYLIQVRVQEIVIHDIDVANALSQFIIDNSITTTVLGSSSRNAFTRYLYLSYFTILERICWLSFLFFTCLKTYGGSYQSRKCCFVVSNRAFKTSTDIIGSLTKSVPDFCTVYIVSKSKAITAKSASRSPTSGNKIRVKRPYLDFNQ